MRRIAAVLLCLAFAATILQLVPSRVNTPSVNNPVLLAEDPAPPMPPRPPKLRAEDPAPPMPPRPPKKVELV